MQKYNINQQPWEGDGVAEIVALQWQKQTFQ